MEDVLVGLRRGVVDFVDDDVIEGFWVELISVEAQHRSGGEDEIRVDGPVSGFAGEKAIGTGRFEYGLEGFLGANQDRVFVDDEKEAFGVEVLRVEGRQEGFPRTRRRDDQRPFMPHAPLPSELTQGLALHQVRAEGGQGGGIGFIHVPGHDRVLEPLGIGVDQALGKGERLLVKRIEFASDLKQKGVVGVGKDGDVPFFVVEQGEASDVAGSDDDLMGPIFLFEEVSLRVEPVLPKAKVLQMAFESAWEFLLEIQEAVQRVAVGEILIRRGEDPPFRPGTKGGEQIVVEEIQPRAFDEGYGEGKGNAVRQTTFKVRQKRGRGRVRIEGVMVHRS